MESISDSATARKVGAFANGQVNSFLESVEDLTKALKDVETPDIARSGPKSKWLWSPPRAPSPMPPRKFAIRRARPASARMSMHATTPGKSSA